MEAAHAVPERPQTLSLAFFDPAFVVKSDRRTALAAAVDAAIALTGADMGNVQLWEPGRGVLRIEAQRGFAPPFLEFFAGVQDGQAACSLALQRAARVIVEDVAESPIVRGTPALDVMLDAGARAIQFMPLISASGHLLGLFSTHWHRPRRPREGDLRLLALLARRTACVLEWKATRVGPESRCIAPPRHSERIAGGYLYRWVTPERGAHGRVALSRLPEQPRHRRAFAKIGAESIGARPCVAGVAKKRSPYVSTAPNVLRICVVASRHTNS